jgi:hypothetical protein
MSKTDITRHHVFSGMGYIYETHFPNSGHASSLLELAWTPTLKLAKVKTTRFILYIVTVLMVQV